MEDFEASYIRRSDTRDSDASFTGLDFQSVRHVRTFRYLATLVLRSRSFEYFVALLIVANGIVLGIQADWCVRHLSEPLPVAFEVLDYGFAGAFALELLLRLVSLGKSFFSMYARDFFWNIFDGLLVISALVEITLSIWFADVNVNLSTGRLLRLLRLVRVVRVIRVLRFFRDLRVMVLSIMGSLRPLIFALFLLSILMYIFAVCLLQFVTEELERLGPMAGRLGLLLQENYGTLPTAVYTLFLSISGGLSWVEACNPLIEITPLLGLIFMLYIAFSVFCVLNIITGIFVEEATTMTAQDEENMLLHELQKRKRFIAEAKRLFEEADEDGSGKLTWEEFREALQHVRVQKLLENLGIDVVATGVRNVFDLFDFDGDGTLEISEFTQGLFQLRGYARSIDIAQLRHDQTRVRRKFDSFQDRIEEQLRLHRDKLEVLHEATAGAPPARDCTEEAAKQHPRVVAGIA